MKVNKFLKKSFGSKNFSTAQPSNGVYVKLISSSLSKKGNWYTIYKNFKNLSLKFRQLFLFNCLNSFLFKNNRSENLLSSCQNKNLDVFKKLAVFSFLKSGNRINFLNNQLLFLSNLNKQQESQSFSSLKTIHSLFQHILVSIELKSKRRGGRVFLVPVPVKSERRRHSIFIRWFKKSLLENTFTSVNKNIKDELSQLFLGRGKSMERLNELDKAIKLNRVFLRKSQVKLI